MTTQKFDPNAAALSDSGIFGLPFTEDQSLVVYVPVPWEATTSYGGGTSEGPQAILTSSKQVDLYDTDVLNPYEVGLHMIQESNELREWNSQAKADAQKIIEASGITDGQPALEDALSKVNTLGSKLNQWVFEQTASLLDKDKIVGIVGGDHSVPFGALQAISKKHPSFGILHFDAHSDTRKAYEGFTWSHASIMYNVLENIPSASKLVQVGIRDVCEEEIQYCASQPNRVKVFLDRDLQRKKYQGKNWDQICQSIIDELPQKVWISFDIDGLDPRFCPHTGTPVPGGLDFQEANYLIGALVRSGRTIIGFDLNEVAPNTDQPSDEWDANVGARMLYKLTAWTLASQKQAKLL